MSADVQNSPMWLKELSGESPVLSSSEWDLVLKVQSMAQKRFNVKTSHGSNGEMSPELSYFVGKLQKLIKHQKMYEDSGRYFKQYYPQWRPIRDENIKILKEIANTIQENKENCDGVRLAGSIASLIGGGTSLVAEDEDSVAAQFGRGITLLGSAFAAGSTLVEEFLLDQKIKEAKDTVEKDRFFFDLMWSCHVESREHVASLNEVFEEIDTDRYEWQNVREVIESFLSATGENTYEQLTMEKENEIDVNRYQWRNLWKVVESFLFSSEKYQSPLEISIQKMLNSLDVPSTFQEEFSDFVAVIMSISMVWKRHRPLFELATNAFKIKTQFETFARNLLRALNIWSKFGAGSKKSMIVAGMLMDVVNIVNTCEEFNNKAQRKESENVRKIAKILEREANELRGMYHRFLQCDMHIHQF